MRIEESKGIGGVVLRDDEGRVLRAWAYPPDAVTDLVDAILSAPLDIGVSVFELAQARLGLSDRHYAAPYICGVNCHRRIGGPDDPIVEAVLGDQRLGYEGKCEKQ